MAADDQSLNAIVEAAVARYSAKLEQLKPAPELPRPSKEAQLEERIARLENLLDRTLSALNGATIECADGSVVLTLPDLPEAP